MTSTLNVTRGRGREISIPPKARGKKLRMSEAEIALVALIAQACAAALGNDRISTARLVAACRTVPELATVTRGGVGRAMKAAGFERAQWREMPHSRAWWTERVRGYRVKLSEKAT